MSTHHDCLRAIGARSDKDFWWLIGVLAVATLLMGFTGWSEDYKELIIVGVLAPILMLFKRFRPTEGEVDGSQEGTLIHRKAVWTVKQTLKELSEQYDWFSSIALVPQGKDIDFVLVGPNGVTSIEVKSWSNSNLLNPTYWLNKIGFQLEPVKADTMRMREELASIGITDSILQSVIVRADTPNLKQHQVEGGTELGLNYFEEFITSQAGATRLSDAERHSVVETIHEKAGCGGWKNRTRGQKIAFYIFTVTWWSMVAWIIWFGWTTFVSS